MMLASLSSYCQYPLVKTIGKDTVVIMTVKQGEDINKQFNALGDSISVSKAQNIALEKQLVEQQVLFNSNLSKLKQTLDKTEKHNAFLKAETERLKGLIWTEAKVARRHSIFMIGGIIAFTAMSSIIFK